MGGRMDCVTRCMHCDKENGTGPRSYTVRTELKCVSCDKQDL